MALIPYGLSQENAKKLRLYLNEQAKKVAKIEAENSEIIPTSDGGEFIRIKAFPDAGGVLRKEVESEIDSYFSGFNDDRAQIFKKQLFRTILYDDFGSTSKEISIDTAIAPGGDPNTPGYVLTIKRYKDGVLVSGRSDPFSVSLMKGRYGSILEKHKSKLTPNDLNRR